MKKNYPAIQKNLVYIIECYSCKRVNIGSTQTMKIEYLYTKLIENRKFCFKTPLRLQ